MPKLVGAMLCGKEADRYLELVIRNNLKFLDELVILFNNTDDASVNLIKKIQSEKIKPIHYDFAKFDWNHEWSLRKELIDKAMSLSPDWIISIDTDEYFEDTMAEEVQAIMKSDKECAWFRVYDCWNSINIYRRDEWWNPDRNYATRMFRYDKNKKYEWNKQDRHCQSIPINILERDFSNVYTGVTKMRHLGWANKYDRLKKYLEREAEDRDRNYTWMPKSVYDSILEDEPHMERFDYDLEEVVKIKNKYEMDQVLNELLAKKESFEKIEPKPSKPYVGRNIINIIIPVYNSVDTLYRLLNSIKKQTDLKGVNVIISDDNSDDDYNAFLDYYSDYFPIKYAKNDKNCGAGVARQIGLNLADGEYVMFCDADDILFDEDAIKNIKEVLTKYPDQDIIWSDMEKIDENGNKYRTTVKESSHLQDKIYKLDYLRKNNIRFHDTLRYSEDSYFNTIALYLTEKKIFTNLCYYRAIFNKKSYTNTTDKNVVLEKFKDTITFMIASSNALYDKNRIMSDFMLYYSLYYLYLIYSYCDFYEEENSVIDDYLEIIDNNLYDERKNELFITENVVGNEILIAQKSGIFKHVSGLLKKGFFEKFSFYDFIENVKAYYFSE